MQTMDFLTSLNSMLVLFLLPFTVFLVFLFSSKSNGSSDSKYYYPPGVEPYPILGHLPQFLMNRHRLADWIFESLAATPTKTMLFKRPGGIRDVVTADPTNVEHILRANFDVYPKGSRTGLVLHDFLGHGIFNADHETWRHQRKTASYEFNTTSLRSFVVTCVQQEIVDRLMPLLTKASKSGSIVDPHNVLERFAFDNICKVAFNFDPSWLSGDDIEGRISGELHLEKWQNCYNVWGSPMQPASAPNVSLYRRRSKPMVRPFRASRDRTRDLLPQSSANRFPCIDRGL